MKRSAINPMPEFFDQYINRIDDIELKEAFEKSLLDISNIDKAALEAIGDKTYAPGKWTIKDILQHIIDTERVMSYRALRFARNDKTPLSGFDQDLFTAEAKAGKKTVSDLLDELKTLRQCTIALYRDFDEDTLSRAGISNKRVLSVLALGFIIAGHQLHHLQLIKEKYMPLLH